MTTETDGEDEHALFASNSAPTDRAWNPILRIEWILLAALVLVAFLLRVAHLDRLAVEHFDEGVYVSNLWFGPEQDFRYPYRHLYAPPLVPALLEWSMILFGTGTWGTMLPGIVFGTATVPLAWFANREWFGRWAGWAAGLLLAFADQHVLFSRSALVDVPLCFWVLLAVWLTWRAFTRDSWRWAVAAGAATGLAWWTKYNGWLPLAIGLAGGLPWAIFGRGDEARPTALRVTALWLVVFGVALVVWSPVLWGLQPYGGFAEVTRTQTGYVVGFGGWGDGFATQMRNARWTGRAWNGVGLCLVTAVLLIASHRASGSRRAIVGALLLLSGGTLLAAFGVGILLLASGLVVLARGSMDELNIPCLSSQADADGASPRRRADTNRSAARWLLAAWFVGLLVATPFYRAYPRLLLPWLVSSWLIAAAGIGMLVDAIGTRPFVEDRAEGSSGGLPAGFDVAVPILGALVTMFAIGRGPQTTAWGDRSGLARIADEVAADIDRSRSVLYTFAEPAAFHHLRRRGVTAIPAGDLDAVTRTPPTAIDVYLLVGENARRTPTFAAAWDRLGHRFELVERFEDTPSRLVELNLFDPRELATHSGPSTIPVRLYRLQPESSPARQPTPGNR